jgi:hypothetical protein
MTLKPNKPNCRQIVNFRIKVRNRNGNIWTRLSAADASWLSPITIAGNSDHDRLETVIKMLWNG